MDNKQKNNHVLLNDLSTGIRDLNLAIKGDKSLGIPGLVGTAESTVKRIDELNVNLGNLIEDFNKKIEKSNKKIVYKVDSIKSKYDKKIEDIENDIRGLKKVKKRRLLKNFIIYVGGGTSTTAAGAAGVKSGFFSKFFEWFISLF